MADFGTFVLALGLTLGVAAGGADTDNCRHGKSKGGASADGDRCTTFTLQEENDTYLNGGDRYYTQGLQLRWTSPETAQGGVYGGVQSMFRVSRLWQPDDGARTRASVGVGQNIYTPANITERRPIPQDRPYAGWSYLSLGATAQSPLGAGQWLDGIELDLGMIGPGSGAKFAQTQRHKAIGVDLPAGWGNQIDNEPGLVLYRQWTWRTPDLVPGRTATEPKLFDVAPHGGLAFGNVFTYGAAGATLRLGYNLPDDFGPSGIRPGLPGSSFSVPTDGFSVYAFAGGEQRAVLRNAFLDGGLIGSDPRVEKRTLVHDLYAGAAVQVLAFRFVFAEVMRSPEFDGQSKRHQFGALTLSWRF